jgi:RimJ/RimL family protein N-acetyltransferase
VDELRPVILAPADPAFVSEVFRSMWGALSDDSSGSPEDFAPVDSPLVEYVAPTLHGQRLGVLMLVQVNAATVELHTALLPEHRGPNTAAVFDALRAHLRARGVSRLRTWVPACNRPAYVAALRVGFELVGTESRAFLKDGALHDLHLFGVTL